MDTKNLLAFKTIVQMGSYQKAADVLGYTPSTITFQIKQLEQELSLQLFEKIGRRMVLTEAGQNILPIVDEILQSCDIISNYGRTLEETEGTLTVAMPETLLIYRMQEVLHDFKEQAPNVNLYVYIGNCDKVRDDVLKGSVDIGIHYDVCQDHSSICCEKIGEHHACLVTYPELDENEMDFISPDQTKRVSMINYYADSIFQEKIEEYLKGKNIVISTMMELWSVEAIKKNVMNQLGIAYLPQDSVAEEIEKGTLKKIKTDIDDMPIDVVCEFHKNKWMSPQMELFLELVRRNCGQK